MAMGVVDSFSWKDVAVGGLTSVVSAGVGHIAKGANAPSWAKSAVSAMKQSDYIGYASRGVFNYTSSQIVNRVVGLDTSFSWRGMAASVVGSTVGGSASDMVDADGLPGAVISGQVSAHSSAVIRDKWFGGGRPSYGQIAADAFGNSLANAALDLMEPSTADISKAGKAAKTGKASSAISMNSKSASLGALRSEMILPESIPLDLAKASLVTNPFERMHNAEQQPGTLTRAELQTVAHIVRDNDTVLPRDSSVNWGIDPALIQTSREETIERSGINGLSDFTYRGDSKAALEISASSSEAEVVRSTPTRTRGMIERAARGERAAQGSTEMPVLEAGNYTVVSFDVSVGAKLIGVGMGDFYIKDDDNKVLLHFGTVRAGYNVSNNISLEYGKMKLTDPDNIEGQGYFFELPLRAPVSVSSTRELTNPTVTSGYSVARSGLSAGFNYTYFKKAYHYDELSQFKRIMLGISEK
jgi:hypothetical protein